MVQMAKHLVLTLPLIALSAAPALAHDGGRMMGGDNRSVTMGGNGRNGMMGGDRRSGMTGRGMEGCMRMMEGMQGRGSQRPNEQWRR